MLLEEYAVLDAEVAKVPLRICGIVCSRRKSQRHIRPSLV
jgi:hypothetical protein